MAKQHTGIAELFGVPPDALEGDFKIHRPEDPQKIKYAHDKEMLLLRLIGWLSGAGLLLAFALSWLFLYYGKPEQAEKVVATVIGFIGGIGIGRYTLSKELPPHCGDLRAEPTSR
jgi:hypothetical protein